MKEVKTYNHKFYNDQLIQSRNSASYIVPIINNWFEPKNVVDIGCGIGAWLEIWKNQSNVKEVNGVDAKFVDKSLMRIDVESEFIEADLNTKIPKLKSYDLAMCLEVAEHLEESRANSFVEDLTKLSNVILFSAAIPGQEGTHHINEQYIGYWIEKFEQNNFKCYDVVRPLIWNVDSIAWWFRQNTVIFVKTDDELKVNLDSMQSFNCFDLVQKDLLKHKDNKYLKHVTKINSTKKIVKKIIKKIIP